MSVVTDYGPLVRVLNVDNRSTVMVRDDIHPAGWTEHRSYTDEFAVVDADQKARELRRSILEGEYAS